MSKYGELLVKLKNSDKPLLRASLKRDFDCPIVILWHLDYYDGPLSGIAWYKNSPHYFELYNDEFSSKRIYILRPLTREQFLEELFKHEMFRLYVGIHTDHHFSIHGRLLGAIHDRKTYSKFYDEIPPINRDYSNIEPVAYFRF